MARTEDYLDGDHTDVLEATVLMNKKKTNTELLDLLKKDSYFNKIKISALKRGIKDTKLVYFNY